MNCDEMEQLIKWTEKINYIMNKTILKRVALLVAVCLVLFLVIVAGQTETQTSLDLKKKEFTFYADYEFVLVGDENGSLGGVDYVGILAHRKSMTSCRHIIINNYIENKECAFDVGSEPMSKALF